MVDDQDSEEAMEKDSEPSPGCLNAKNSLHVSQENGNATEEKLEQKEEMNVHPGGVESINSLQTVPFMPLRQVYNRPTYHQQFWVWPNIFPDIRKSWQGQMSTFENHFYPVNRDFCLLPIENRIQYVPLKTFFQGYHELQFQEFQYFVVIDFEATCDKERKPHPQEIIEFPSVLVNSVTGELEGSFQTYVRPAYHQLLSEFCKELTGIQQIQVDRGVPLGEALLMHDKWLEDKGIKHKSFAVVTWGNWDCHIMLESECKFKRIRKPPYFNRWINLKVPFQYAYGGVHCNLKEAVQLTGLTWEGRPHCGLDDARNTARLLSFLMRRGFRFSITNELPLRQPGNRSFTYQPLNNQPIDPTQQLQKLKEVPWPVAQFHPFMDHNGKESCNYCYCGVMSRKGEIRKPGPMQGKCFFGCGNWSAATRRAACSYFVWASP